MSKKFVSNSMSHINHTECSLGKYPRLRQGKTRNSPDVSEPLFCLRLLPGLRAAIRILALLLVLLVLADAAASDESAGAVEEGGEGQEYHHDEHAYHHQRNLR